jgi:hypothetical protein
MFVCYLRTVHDSYLPHFSLPRTVLNRNQKQEVCELSQSCERSQRIIQFFSDLHGILKVLSSTSAAVVAAGSALAGSVLVGPAIGVG